MGETQSTTGLSRRSFLKSLAATTAASMTGCASRFGLVKCDIPKDLPFPELVAHLNRNTDQIDAWRCSDTSIKPHGPFLLVPSLSANIAVERPRNFRLTACPPMGGNDLVDLGSNAERFWFWTRNNEQPGILTARHDCLQAAQQHLPLPFEPDWLIEVMGVIPLDENEIEHVKHPTDPKKCYFHRKRTSPDGTSLELVTTVNTCRGVIEEYSLRDEHQTIIALAQLGDHQRDGQTGVVLPHLIKMSWPQTNMGLTFSMGRIEVNPTSLSEKQFTMPRMANCPVYDIGEETRQASGSGRSKV